MASSNVETYRAGHEAFNQRDFEAMTKRCADSAVANGAGATVPHLWPQP
jgi:hypothetical protein